MTSCVKIWKLQELLKDYHRASDMKNIYTISVIALMFIISCGDPQKKIAGNYTYETECISTELDGSETIMAWGSGSNKNDAVEQAKKNGIRDMLFKGIRKGKSDCNQKPIIFEVNAQEKNEEYFRKFFT